MTDTELHESGMLASPIGIAHKAFVNKYTLFSTTHE